MRAITLWGLLFAVGVVPLIAATQSPFLQWRDPVYVVAGFAGIVGLVILLVQPLLAIGALPGLPAVRGRRVHRWVGGLLVFSVVVHVVGLWITSPPDVVDALLFRSPTPFSVWGVIAMWTLFGTGLLVLLRPRLRFRPATWRLLHAALAVVIVSGTVIHALLIEGAMEPMTKTMLCVAVGIAALFGLRRAVMRPTPSPRRF